MKLTDHTRFSGCGAKLGPGVLAQALCGLTQPAYPELLADFQGHEDAGVYLLSEAQALVQTVDFFPPIVDDPHLFGRIAAANALSDLYAMGARPITALALVAVPLKALGLEALRAMQAGGLEALVEAGCALLGGHSIEDAEPKLGYAVTGLVDPVRAWRNNTLQPGGTLILTKPIGTGLVNMAQRAQCASREAQVAAEKNMATLNRRAAEVLANFSVQACTDVTGFGLAGHAAEMACGETCGLTLWMDRVPLLPGAADYAAMGLIPEGTYRNREGRGGCLDGNPSSLALDLLFDPQTSGGLLACVAEAQAEAALAALHAAGVSAWIIGDTGGDPGVVRVL